MGKRCPIWYVLALAFLILVFVANLPACLSTWTRRPSEATPQAIGPRQITGNTLDMREHWRVSQVYMSGFEAPPLLAASGRVICDSYDFTQKITRLLVLDAVNGNRLWEIGGKPGGSELAVDAERVYLMNPFEIRAYALNDGQQLWESQMSPSRSYHLYSDGEKLHVRDVTYWQVHYFDARTGDKLGKESLLTGDGFALLAQFPAFDLHTSRTALKATDKTTRRLLWVADGVGLVYLRPILSGDVLLVGHIGVAFAIDARSGKMKWHNPDPPYLDIPFGYNFVVADGFLYALDHNARLFQMSVETGQVMGYVQFAPARANTSENFYWVAADGGMLFVYFGDSQELIALGP